MDAVTLLSLLRSNIQVSGKAIYVDARLCGIFPASGPDERRKRGEEEKAHQRIKTSRKRKREGSWEKSNFSTEALQYENTDIGQVFQSIPIL